MISEVNNFRMKISTSGFLRYYTLPTKQSFSPPQLLLTASSVRTDSFTHTVLVMHTLKSITPA